MKKSSVFDKDNLFKDINLKDIFLQEEVDKLLNEPIFNGNNNKKDYESSIEILKKNNNNLNLLYDRTNLILKFLKISIEKLYIYNEDILAKGLEWYS
jgi:hypothetical protein